MLVALSPYHLTTKEPPALAMLLLASSVVTLLPAPFEPQGDVRARAEMAAAALPRYLEFMQSWHWSLPLWRAGVVRAQLDGHDATGDVRAVCRRIDEDPALGQLRPLMRQDLFESDQAYLEALARDLLKGGPDPGVSLPVAAAMDRFATRHALLVARSSAISVAQKAEERLGNKLFAIAIPALLQAEAQRVLWLREELRDVLEELRRAIHAAAEYAGESPEAVLPADLATDVALAGRAYAQAFDAVRDELAKQSSGDEVRAVQGTITLTAMQLPVHAVLESGVRAVEAISGGRRRALPGAADPKLPTLRDPLSGRWFTTLVVKALGR